VLLLFAYKYTSNQAGIERARDDIKANMLAMKLFKDSLRVTFGAMLNVMCASLRILMLSIPPLLVAMVPMVPLLAQMASRYFFAPMEVGKTSTVKVWFSDDFAQHQLHEGTAISLKVPDGVALRTPKPWRSADAKEADWRIRADKPGSFILTVVAGDQEFTKELPVGTYGSITTRISPKRTNFYASMLDNKLMLPWEKPPAATDNVRAIEVTALMQIHAPDVIGIPVLGNWIVFFLVVSIIFALIFKPILKVKI